MSSATATAHFESPIGVIQVKADDSHLLRLKIGGALITQETHNPILLVAITQLQSWFNGTLMDFELPLAPLEGHEAESLRYGISDIPYGETRTYGEIAKRVGSFPRAVGQACKTNALPIIIPCHRVVSTNGPEYYSAGEGPKTKGWLLDFEATNLPQEKRTRLL